MCPVDRRVRQRFELLTPDVAVERIDRLPCVLESQLARLLERARRRHPDERTFERPAGEGGTHLLRHGSMLPGFKAGLTRGDRSLEMEDGSLK